ncbi:MAG: Stage II sporulation protein M [Desulfotomaculum sp. 46_296]|nr:MAG: Stage II sporulation protein M [Desulfotomaculum sp. 46_296]HAU31341.1 stage II sporulation protein M [Desulfotomaculum sp.]
MWNAWTVFWRNCWRQNWPQYLLVLAVFLAGAAFGVLGVNHLSVGQFEELSKHVQTYVSQVDQLSANPAGAASGKIFEDILFIVLLYIFGLSFVGIPFILALLFIRGFILGFAVSFLTQSMAVNGLLLAVVSILPQNLLYLPALLFGGTAAMSFALLSLRRYTNFRIRLLSCLVGYTFIMAVVLAVAICAGLVEIYFTPWLTGVSAGLIETLVL